MEKCVSNVLEGISTVKAIYRPSDHEGGADFRVTLTNNAVISIEAKNWFPQSPQRRATVLKSIYTKWFVNVGRNQPTWKLRENEKDTTKVLVIPRIGHALSLDGLEEISKMRIWKVETSKRAAGPKDSVVMFEIRKQFERLFGAIINGHMR